MPNEHRNQAIRRLTRSMSKHFGEDDEGRQNYHKYQQMMEQPGWKVHQAMIVDIANKLAGYMLTEEFTNLDREEKDVQQRAIFMTKAIIEFLLDPIKEYNRLQRLQQTNYNPKEVTQLRNNPTGGMQ